MCFNSASLLTSTSINQSIHFHCIFLCKWYALWYTGVKNISLFVGLTKWALEGWRWRRKILRHTTICDLHFPTHHIWSFDTPNSHSPVVVPPQSKMQLSMLEELPDSQDIPLAGMLSVESLKESASKRNFNTHFVWEMPFKWFCCVFYSVLCFGVYSSCPTDALDYPLKQKNSPNICTCSSKFQNGID